MSDAKKYVTTQDLFIGADRAHAAGRTVYLTDEQIDRYGWRDYLTGEKTKTAARARKDAQSNVTGPAVIVSGTPDDEQQNTAPVVAEENTKEGE